MPEFIIRQIKEIILEGKVTADNAEQAMMIFKGPNRKSITTASEESHITVNEVKEEEE